jgi:hypothetical protein
MDIKEGEEVQAKRICNIFNKIIAKISPISRKELPIQILEASRTPNRHEQNRASLQHFIIKTTSTENKERILKSVRERNQITYQTPTKITADFSTETVKAGRAWSEVFQVLKEN